MGKTLEGMEPHPAAIDAFAWVKTKLSADPLAAMQLLESFASTGLSGNRTAEICSETLRRILHGETVSDRYLLGLAWTLRNMDEMNKGGERG